MNVDINMCKERGIKATKNKARKSCDGGDI
jgi:hypothetical protein